MDTALLGMQSVVGQYRRRMSHLGLAAKASINQSYQDQNKALSGQCPLSREQYRIPAGHQSSQIDIR
jgi:hypothetical protein